MAVIKQEDLVQSVADALQYISYYHPRDYIQHLARAYEREQSPAAKDAIAQILSNSRMCAEGRRPVCQDTGIVNVFLKIGMGVRLEGFTGSVADAVNEGVRRAYLHPDNKLRASIVEDPVFGRRNTRDNTPAVTHMELVPGNTVAVDVAAKGAGSENKSKFAMLIPSDSIVDWVLMTVPTMGAGWCPPGMLGIGVGGTAEKAMMMAKESLMEPIDMHELQARGPRDGARRQDQDVPDARRVATDRDDSELRRHPAPPLRTRRLGAGGVRDAEPGRLAEGDLGSRRAVQAREPRRAHARGSGEVEAGRDAPSVGENAHRPRRRAQAHPGHAGKGREAPRGFHRPRDLLRRAGRPGARRGRRARGSHHGDPHGQVHRDDARANRPRRHDRKRRTRSRGDRGDQEAQGRLADRGGRRRLPRRQGDPKVQSAGLRRSRHGSDLRVGGEGYAGHGRRRRERHLRASDRPGGMGKTHQGLQDPRRGRVGIARLSWPGPGYPSCVARPGTPLLSPEGKDSSSGARAPARPGETGRC